MSADYGWIIDTDHIDDGADSGTSGPRDMSDRIAKQLDAGEGKPFRMYDDDDELYYSGRFIGEVHEDGHVFGPLDDFGTPNAGATEIRYQTTSGEWETL